MKKMWIIPFSIAVLLAGHTAVDGASDTETETDTAIAAATASLDEYMLRFNARDPEGWAATFNYPHIRIASGQVRIWQTEKEFAEYMDFDVFAQRFGWDHSHWLTRKIISASPDKVHFATTFQRFNDKNEPIATFKSLYVVTKIDGHWGTQVRSSFAP